MPSDFWVGVEVARGGGDEVGLMLKRACNGALMGNEYAKGDDGTLLGVVRCKNVQDAVLRAVKMGDKCVVVIVNGSSRQTLYAA